MWPESPHVNIKIGEKCATVPESREIEFFLRDYFFPARPVSFCTFNGGSLLY